MFELPEKKQKAIVREFKSYGSGWIEGYPALMKSCVDRWGLTLGGIATAGLPINVIHYAETKSGQPVVLKVGVPHPEQKTELIALRFYEGRGAVRVIDWDNDSGAFLMARVSPGTNLREYDFRENESVSTRSDLEIQLMNDLPIPATSIDGLPTLDDWLEIAFTCFRESETSDNEFLSFIVLAEALYGEIKSQFPETYLLHGDLHHENILKDADTGWIAIDPKGVIGPKVMECGRFIQNFIEDEVEGAATLDDATETQITGILNQRLDVFSEVTGFTRKQLASVTFIDQVLASCWSLNSGQKISHRKTRIIRDLVSARL